MRIVICWSNYTGYWAACWRRLSQTPGIDLFVLAFKEPDTSPFDESLLDGVAYRLLDSEERKDKQLVANLVEAHDPDVIQIVGWFVPAYRSIATSSRFSEAKKAMSVDTPYSSVTQQFTRLRYFRYFNHIDAVGVTGERSWQYVRRLGFDRAKIRRHMYGVDEKLAERTQSLRQKNLDKKRFLFVGRYAPEKGMDILIEAYRRYRDLSSDPWDLVCCGGGEFAESLKDIPGVIDAGFVSPRQISREFARAGAYVISSRFDPWPLAVVEAAMAGLPIIASDACGSAVEIVRPNYNGFVTAVGDARELSLAMLGMESSPLDVWGDRSRAHALPFTSQLWAERWSRLFQELRAR